MLLMIPFCGDMECEETIKKKSARYISDFNFVLIPFIDEWIILTFILKSKHIKKKKILHFLP